MLVTNTVHARTYAVAISSIFLIIGAVADDRDEPRTLEHDGWVGRQQGGGMGQGVHQGRAITLDHADQHLDVR